MKELEKIRKKLKMESLMGNDIKYYTFLLDMFKYGIILDDMQKLIDKLNDIEVKLADSNNIVDKMINSNEIIPIKIELFDLIIFDYDGPPANIEVILTPKLPENNYSRCISAMPINTELYKLLFAVIHDYTPSLELDSDSHSLLSMMMPVKIIKNIVEGALKELRNSYPKCKFVVDGIYLYYTNYNYYNNNYNYYDDECTEIPYDKFKNLDDNTTLLQYIQNLNLINKLTN